MSTATEFTKVLEQHKALLYKIARSYTQTPQDCQDLVQEIAIALWQAFPRYNAHYQYSTWIYRIGLNVSISRLRKETNRIRSVELLSDELLQLTQLPPEDENAAVTQLYTLIGALNELDKAIMLLYLDGKPYREMADVTGLSETNIATKIGRIKDKWRQQLTP